MLRIACVNAPAMRCNACVCGGNSFSDDTLVSTPEGDVPISEIEVGDTVLASYVNDSDIEVGEYTVTATMQHEDDAIVTLTIDGEQIETTPWHLFYTPDGWMEAGDLAAGDEIYSLDGTTGTVEAVLVEERTQTMYDLTVDEVHTFAVGDGDWVVHNCGTYSDDLLPDVNTHQRNRLPNGQRRPIAIRREWQFTDTISNEVYEGRLASYAETMSDDGRVIAIQPNGDRVRNSSFAGRNFSFDNINHPGMPTLYPRGVDFDLQGFPIFDPYVEATQRISYMVGGEIDMNEAERLAFPNGRPTRLAGRELIWHHMQDGITMQLVPADLHFAVQHSGGESIIGWRP